MQLIEANDESKYRIDLMWHVYNTFIELIEKTKIPFF